jgi:diguanylate cyclase (GGDEF)-like protein
MKILVADDSRFYRNMLQGLLEPWGYEVVLATDGHEAQRILDGDDSPRLAILDCLMPGLSGLEVCEHIRARKQGYVYTILLSVDDRQSDVLRGFEFGADDYLCKPFKQLELRTRLKVGELIIRSQEEVVEAHEALKFEASHDLLMRIWNRRAIIELLGKELSRAKRMQAPISVLLADLDLFKRVNDLHGLLVGDEVLRSAAERMAIAVRKDDYVGRYEGEEFLVVLPSCTAEAAREVAERVRQALADEPLPHEVEMTVSIGVSQWRSGQKVRDLLHLADVALCRAKQNGRNRVEVENVSEADSV